MMGVVVFKNAKMWWREHRNTTNIDDPKRIRNWDMLKKALMKTFIPVEAAENVRNKLRELKQKGTVAAYNAAFRRLSMQITMSFDEAKYVYLQGLSSRVRDLVRTKDELTDIRELQLACLRLEDNGKTSHGDLQTSKAFTVNASSKTRTSKSKVDPPQGIKHTLNYSRGRGRSRHARGHPMGQGLKCYMCEGVGHRAAQCPKLADFREMLHKSKQQPPQANIAVGSEVTIIDSGASQHMFKRQEMFQTLSPQLSSIASASESSHKLKSLHVGTINLNMGTNGQDTTTTLHNVLHVPELRQNLLSVRALTKEGNDVVFKQSGTVELIDNNQNSQEIGHAVGDIYHLTTADALSAVGTSSIDDYVLWHHRFGHPSRKNIIDTTKACHWIGEGKLKIIRVQECLCRLCICQVT